MPEPYRILFPLGVLYGLIGAGAWTAHLLGIGPYPSVLHRTLMIQGFEHGFVLGFLLTAMPGFTHGERCRPLELTLAAAALVVYGAATLAGLPAVAAAAFVASLLVLVTAALRRIVRATLRPPEEFLFVGFALLTGMTAGLLQLAQALGAAPALPPRFVERLISLGMVLPLVLGLGTLLVPTFALMRDPLTLPGIARPHARGGGRRALYLVLIAALAASFALDADLRPQPAGLLRALAGTTLLLLGWKLFRLPGKRDVPAWALWSAGWSVLAGLWLAALAPPWATIAVLHVIFIGGFALLTLGIGTRVVVAHGRHGLPAERVVLGGWVVVLLAAALVLRLAADFVPARMLHLLAGSGLAWVACWALWATGALPRMLRTRPAPPPAGFVPVGTMGGGARDAGARGSPPAAREAP